MLKCNAELVDIVFRLMFETFWVAPYDLRRDFPVLVNFERHARHASVLLGKIDFASNALPAACAAGLAAALSHDSE